MSEAKEAVSAAPVMTRDERIAKIREMQAELRKEEAKTGGSGAIPFTPKGMLLDATDVQRQHPDKHIRWGNLKNEDKMQVRLSQGYERVPVTEGGKQVGNLALIAQPLEKHLATVAEIERRTRERLTAHKAEVEEMANQVAKVLRDKHGVNVRPEDFLIQG